MKTLKELRKTRKLNQKESDQILNISKEYLLILECSKRKPSDKLKEKMAKLYNVSVNEIYNTIKTSKKIKFKIQVIKSLFLLIILQ